MGNRCVRSACDYISPRCGMQVVGKEGRTLRDAGTFGREEDDNLHFRLGPRCADRFISLVKDVTGHKGGLACSHWVMTAASCLEGADKALLGEEWWTFRETLAPR